MRIVGLCSTFREGRLALSAVRSLLPACDVVHVWDGPIGGAPPAGQETDWAVLKREPRVIVRRGAWETDAAKRTAMLEGTRSQPTPTWGVILDGDELLLHGEQISALIEHHERQADAEGHVSFGATLRLVEGDGSLGLIAARVLRLDLIERWLISSYHFLLRSGVEVSRGNAYLLQAGEPDRADVEETTGMQVRRPLQGEPHILHQSFLRPPQRLAERQSAAEGAEFEDLVRRAGMGVAHGEQASDDRVGIWLPQG